MLAKANMTPDFSVSMIFSSGVGPCTSMSSHPRYVPAPTSVLAPQSKAVLLYYRGQAPASNVSGPSVNLPKVPTFDPVGGSTGNFATFFSRHDTTRVSTPSTGKRQATSIDKQNSFTVGSPAVAVSCFSTRPPPTPVNSGRQDCDCDYDCDSTIAVSLRTTLASSFIGD